MAVVDFYVTGDNNYVPVSDPLWRGQTFTASKDYDIVAIDLKLYRTGGTFPGVTTVSVRATSGNHPTGGDIDGVTGVIDGNETSDSTPEWHKFVLSAPISLSNGFKYAIVLRCSSAGNSLRWRRDDNTASYAGGNYENPTGQGAPWVSFTTIDLMFRTYDDTLSGTIAASSTVGGPLAFDTIGLIGTIAGIAAMGGPLAFDTTGLIGTIAGIATMGGPLVFESIGISGTIAALSALSGKILHQNIISSVHTQAFNRLVVAGNNKIYYEDI